MNGEAGLLAAWADFYVIVGSAAGALIGLQFVVITLIAEKPIADLARAGSAFATPTIVHFGSVLLLSTLLTMPWQGAAPAAALWGLLGLAGIIYAAIVAGRIRVQAAYQPQFEDWLFNFVLPLVAHAMLALAAIVAIGHVRAALFGVAIAALSLLFVGIHNAWEAVTYHLFVVRRSRNNPRDKS